KDRAGAPSKSRNGRTDTASISPKVLSRDGKPPCNPPQVLCGALGQSWARYIKDRVLGPQPSSARADSRPGCKPPPADVSIPALRSDEYARPPHSRSGRMESSCEPQTIRSAPGCGRRTASGGHCQKRSSRG